MSTNNPNALDLNRAINTYSSDEAERLAYQRMQEVGFKIADILIEMPLGTMADLGQGECLFVAPYAGRIEVFSTPDWHDNCRWGDVNWFFLNDYQGLAAEDLDEHRVTMENWLKNPVFRQCVPADNAFKVVAAQEEWAQNQTGAAPSKLNRYDHDNVKNLIGGYMVTSKSKPQETRVEQFSRAKAELIGHLERQLQQVKGFTFSDLSKNVS
ncbi:hypothetical protein [Pseudomonas chlororaphis]|uniref:hypothetical protein n=1 Tax=Pseudomonas chlororaphis TaxID=587753 RepID=UPI0024081BBE|nr:hypothetical protein [Pseudomonas chlororaphis]